MKGSYGSYGSSVPGYGTSLVDRINLYLHFRRYFKLLRERWLLLLVFTSVGLGIGVWLAVTKPDQYESTAVLARPPRMQVQSGFEETGTTVETLLAMMQTEEVIQRVLDRLQQTGDSTNALVRPDIVARQGRGNMFFLVASGTNYNYAKEFVSAWATEFVDFMKQQRRGMVSTTRAQLEQQQLQFERLLDQKQQALDDFRRKRNVTSVQEAGVAAQARLERTQAEYANLNSELELYLNAKAETLAAQGLGTQSGKNPRFGIGGSDDSDEGSASGSAMAVGSRYSEIRKAIRNIELDLEDKLKELKEQHPYIVRQRETVTRLKNDLKFELQLVEEARQGQIEALKTRMSGYPKLIEDIRAEVFESADTRNQLLRLEDEAKSVQNNLSQTKSQLDAMGRVSTEEVEFVVVSTGRGSAAPVGPNRPKIILGGAGTGLAMAIAIMFLLHRLDDRIENPEEIEAKLEEPILGQLPEVDKRHNTEGYLLLTRMKPHTMFAEALRGVRSALLLGPDGASKRMLAVTSAVPGDGKTTFTTNFAATLAAAGNRTLLIDADLRRGNIHNYFEQPLEGGLAEVLDGRLTAAEAIHETPIQNLWLMRAGERPSNPSELLLGARTKQLIEELRGQFDYVVFDCPPLTAIDDTFSIAAYLDGLLFVVRAGRTSIRFARLAVNTIRQRGAPLVGLVVNGVSLDNPYYYYTTYYYASYYHKPLAPSDAVYADRGRSGQTISAPAETREAIVVPAVEDVPEKKQE